MRFLRQPISLTLRIGTQYGNLKGLEEEEGAALTRTGSLSYAIQDLAARPPARLHEEAQAVIDQHVALVTQRQQAQVESAELTADLAALGVELAQAHATIADMRATHSDAQAALQQRTIEVERLTQQAQDLGTWLAEHEGFRRPVEDKLQHADQALEHFRHASKEQREQQVQQLLRAELRQANQPLIVEQGEIT